MDGVPMGFQLPAQLRQWVKGDGRSGSMGYMYPMDIVDTPPLPSNKNI